MKMILLQYSTYTVLYTVQKKIEDRERERERYTVVLLLLLYY